MFDPVALSILMIPRGLLLTRGVRRGEGLALLREEVDPLLPSELPEFVLRLSFSLILLGRKRLNEVDDGDDVEEEVEVTKEEFNELEDEEVSFTPLLLLLL